jgi:hypothetical protein
VEQEHRDDGNDDNDAEGGCERHPRRLQTVAPDGVLRFKSIALLVRSVIIDEK